MFSEFRFAARSLIRWRAGALTAVLTLALGVAATTALYGLVRVMLADLPGVPDTDRIARIYASSASLGVERSPVAFAEFDTTLSRAGSFQALGAYADEDAVLGATPDPAPIVAGYASPGFFAAMQVPPAAGRLFSAEDLDPSRHVTILSHALWKRLFPDERLSGATVIVDGLERAVVGVMPAEFNYGFVGITADLWIPIGSASPVKPGIVAVYGRLRPGVSWSVAAAELAGLAKDKGPWTWRAIPLRDDTRKRAMSAYAFTLGPALLVLLIACINVACLLMARGLERDKELSVRRALGATRARVVRLLLIESAAVALVAGATGMGLAMVVLRAVGAALAQAQPALAGQLSGGNSLLPVALASSAIACVLFGLTPALRLSRRDVAASLNGVPATHRIQIAGYGGRDLIVFGEIACSIGLIVWTAMIFTLFGELQRVGFTFPADRLVAMRVPAATAAGVVGRVAAIPGVASVTTSSAMLGGGSRVRVDTEDGRTAVMTAMPVGEAFFRTLDVPIVRGRAFDRTETNAASGVAILTETAARQLAPDGNVLGLRLHVADHTTGIATVVGVCRDLVDYGALARAEVVTGEIYLPSRASAGETAILARVSTEPHALLASLAAAARTPPGVRPVRPVVLSDDWRHRNGANDAGLIIWDVFGGFAVLTLLLAASGVFAVISQSVAQRTTEFGVRMALGAAPRRVLSMVLARETKLIGAAVGSGVVVTVGLTRVAFSQLVALNAATPSMWLLALAMSSGVAAIAVALATWRIVRLEPAAVLRRL